jgi:hypothetical protein
MNRTIIRFTALACWLIGMIHPLLADEAADLEKAFDKAATRLTNERCLLRYKFQAGEKITYRVEQLATVDTTISANNQQTKLRSVSVRTFEVDSVDDARNMTFRHVIDEVDLWSEVAGRQPVRYNSRTDAEAPPEFENVREMIGKPISIVTMNPRGIIVKREDQLRQPNLGMGGLSIPLPEAEIPVGYKWATPLDVRIRMEDQTIKTIKTRELYELKKVEAGIATIAIKTEVLTPVSDPKVKSQLVQRLSTGEIRFDADAGRLESKQLDWDETVIGFSGADSNMKYLARFTEKLTPRGDDSPAAVTARQPAAAETK